MPQIQMLPASPGFGSQLGAALGQGLGGGIQQSMAQHLKQKEMTNLLESLGVSIPKQPSPLRGKSPEAVSGMPAIQALGPQGEAQQQGGLQNLRPEQLVAATIMNPELGKTLGTIYEGQQRAAENTRKFELKNIESAEKAAAPFMEQVQGWQSTLPELSTSIDLAEDAVKNNELSGFNKDYWAEKLGFPQLTSAKGKQLAVATKNFMTQGKDIFGARLTNYDVSLLEKMFARLGESKWASLSAIETQKLRRDLLQEKVNITNDIRRQVGYTPRNIDLLVEDRMKKSEQDLRDKFKAKIELYSALDGQKTDFRYVKKTLKPDEALILKNGKPMGIAKKSELKELQKKGYDFLQ